MTTVDTDVALLKREAEQNAQIVTKLDNAIEKLTDLGNDITKMLALHEQRLDRLEQIDNEIHGLVEKRRVELQADIKYLDGKLASTIKEISDKVDSTEDRLMDFMKEIKAELTKDSETRETSHDELVKRVESLEKWRWMVVGASALAAFVLEKVFPVVLHIAG